jgi:gamma-glutamylputrescine oxidase
MSDLPYWLDMPYTSRSSLSKDIETDVVVLGAGITGVSAAYHCAKAGLKTILIEKEVVAFGSAGRNGGMIVDGLAIDFAEAIEEFGIEEARELWMDTIEARKHVISLIHKHHINCDFTQPGSLYIGFDENDSKNLKKEAEARKNEGMNCEIIKKGTQFESSPFGTILFNPEDCTLHPVKFVRGLAEAAEKYGVTIYENTPALTFDAHTVTTPKGVITAQKVVLALESANPYITEKEAEIIRSQAIVTEPLSDEKINSLNWSRGGMFWVAGSDYISCRKIGNRIFACKVLPIKPTPEEMEKNKEWQISKLLSFFPTLSRKDIVVSHQWSGLMVDTHNHRPYIRENNGCYEVYGQGGNGLTNGIMCGKLISDFFLGEKIPEIYKPHDSTRT